MRCMDEGFEAFFATEYDGVVRSLTLAFGDRSQAEEAAQVGFERALRRWRYVGEMDRPGTWVYVVAVRHGRRALVRDRAFPGEVVEVVEVAAGPEATAVTVLWLGDALRRLPPRRRAVVVLRHLGELSLAEISEALGIAVGTVKSTLHAAYAQLRVDLSDEDDEGDVGDVEPSTNPEEVVPDASERA